MIDHTPRSLLLLCVCLYSVSCTHEVPVAEVTALRNIFDDMNGVNWKWNTYSGIPWNFSLPDAETHPCRPNEEGLIWQRVSCASSVLGDGGIACTADYCTIVRLDFTELHHLDGVVPESIVELKSLRELTFLQAVSETDSDDTYYNLPMGENGGMPAILGNLTSLMSLKIGGYSYPQGRIPHEYSNLVALRTLSIYGCNVTGPLPAGLSTLENLQVLRLFDNPLQSSIPADYFERMTALTNLRLSDSFITGSLPSSLQNRITLQHLDIENNLFNSSLRSFDMPLLSELHMKKNLFTGIFPFSTGNLSALEILEITDNYLTGHLPNDMTRLVSLKRLEADRNLFSGTIPDSIGNFSALSRLDMSMNKLTGSLPPTLGNLPTLQYLELEENGLSSVLPARLGALSELREFNVRRNNMTGSIPNEMSRLKKLRQLYLNENHFSSSLPTGITALTGLQFFYCSDNSLVGSLPVLGGFQSMIYLNVSFNQLTGHLPLSLCSMASLQDIEFQNNHLSGQLPDCLGDLTRLKYLRLEKNRLEGSVPSSIGNLEDLIHLNLNENRLSSTIPASLSQLSSLLYLYLSDNGLTGTLPESLSQLSGALQDLDVGNNRLSGTVPLSLGLLSKLNVLSLSFNSFTGVAPTSFSSLSQLRILQLNGNAHSGPLGLIFPPDVNLPLLQIFDASDNALTGSLPTSLFTNLPNLSTVSLSLNCLSGTLPPEVCAAGSLRVLSFDGMGSSAACQGYGDAFFWPQGLSGSIPQCLLALPSLLQLHLSANSLTGSIPSESFSPSLRNLSLAHNHLSSTIPQSLQEGQLHRLDLSHNKVTGVWRGRSFEESSGAVVITEMEVKLAVNRLSGDLPHTPPAVSVDLLRGNIFGCEAPLPEHDPSREDYFCGSSQLEQAEYFLLGSVCVIALVAAGYVAQLYKRDREKPLCLQAEEGTEVPLSERVRGGMSPLEVQSGSVEESGSAGAHDLGSMLSFLSPRIYILVFFLNYLDDRLLPNIRSFQDSMKEVARAAVSMMLLGVLLSVPVFALKLSEEGVQAFHFTTHTHTYGWVLSTAFTTGYIPSLLVLFPWAVMVCRLVSSESGGQPQLSDGTVLPPAVETINPLSNDCPEEEELPKPNKTAERSPQEFLGGGASFRLWAVFLANVLVVGAVNGAYIFSTLQSYSAASMIMIQYSVAVFKIVWDVFIVPVLFRGAVAVSSSRTRTRLKLITLMFNSIVVPCLVTVCSSPSCFRGLFVQPHKISSSYVITVCELFAFTAANQCDHYVSRVVDITPFYPPFSYNYQCSSTILTSYIPVLLYSYTLLLFLPVLYFLVVGLVPPCTGSSARCSPFPRLVRVLPGILWPDFWSSTEPGGGERKESSCVYSSRQLFRPDDIAASLMHHMAVLLTFGLTSPLLAVAVTGAISFQAGQWLLLLNRFVFRRLLLGGMWMHPDCSEKGTADTTTTAAAASSRVWRDKVVGVVVNSIEKSRRSGEREGEAVKLTQHWEELDRCLMVVEKSVEHFPTLLSLCTVPVVSVSCIFFVFFSWDVAADRVGFVQSAWVPLTALAAPWLLVLGVKWRM